MYAISSVVFCYIGVLDNGKTILVCRKREWSCAETLSTSQYSITETKEKIINLNCGKISFCSWLWRFHSVVTWFYCFGACGKKHMVEQSCVPNIILEVKGFSYHHPLQVTPPSILASFCLWSPQQYQKKYSTKNVWKDTGNVQITIKGNLQECFGF